MVPSLSLSPDQITKPPSASPIRPPHNSELLRRSFTLLSALIVIPRPFLGSAAQRYTLHRVRDTSLYFFSRPNVSTTLRSELVTSTTNFL